jgi:hypothetical protein
VYYPSAHSRTADTCLFSRDVIGWPAANSSIRQISSLKSVFNKIVLDIPANSNPFFNTWPKTIKQETRSTAGKERGRPRSWVRVLVRLG